MLWGWLIDNWSWANGESILRSGRSLLDMTVRDLVDSAFRLLVDWSCMGHAQMKQYEAINKHFRDAEIEYETGVPVLPGWAALGNVAAQYGMDDDPFATLPADQ